MKRKLALLASLALGVATMGALYAPTAVQAEEDLSQKLQVVAVEGRDGAVTITVKSSAPDVYVNLEFNTKLTVESKDGSKLEKAELTKADAKIEASEHKDKAKSLTFTVKSKGIKGKARIVGCSKGACGSPRTVEFESKAAK